MSTFRYSADHPLSLRDNERLKNSLRPINRQIRSRPQSRKTLRITQRFIKSIPTTGRNEAGSANYTNLKTGWKWRDSARKRLPKSLNGPVLRVEVDSPGFRNSYLFMSRFFSVQTCLSTSERVMSGTTLATNSWLLGRFTWSRNVFRNACGTWKNRTPPVRIADFSGSLIRP